MDVHFFRIPFASSGDVAPIPDGPLGDGSLSYAEGFSFDYERNPASDPAAKRIPRDQTNELYKAITENLGEWQRFTAPQWITAADNGGVSYGYAKGALVRQGGVVYGSLINGNTSTPGTDPTKWRELDIFNAAALTAATVDYTNLNLNTVYTTPSGMAKALREGRFTFGTASRVGGAYSVTLLGAAFVQGLGATVEFNVPDVSPAGPLTLKVNALATQPLWNSQGSAAFVAGDLVPGVAYRAVHNGEAWVLTAPVTSQLAPPPDPLPTRLTPQTVLVTPVLDLNGAVENGWYRAQAGVTNGPSALAAGALMVAVDAYDSQNVTQTVWRFGLTSNADRNRWQRSLVAGAWQPWYKVYETATEIQSVAVQPGMVGHTAAAVAPAGWLIRDGSAISQTTYAALFAAIGTMYNTGGEPAGTFRVPNDLINGGLFDRAGVPDGVYYPDTVGPHIHSLPVRSNANTGVGYVEDADSSGTPQTANTGNPTSGDVETAPRHRRYLPIIKY